ncbi:MAG: hypothetical protein ACRDTM_10760 [Micromonosporaceae bacterium]
MTYHPHYPQQQYAPGYGLRTSAPFSVHFVAFFIYLGGLVVLLAAGLLGVLALGSSQLSSADLPPEAAQLILGGGLVIAVILLLISFLYFLIARKLQKGRQWARVLVLIFCVLGLLGGVLNTVMVFSRLDAVPPSLLASLASGFVGPVLFLILLNTTAARYWFKHHTY